MTEWLNGLRKDLLEKTYRASPVKRVTIAKEGGGERPPGIPTIRDRVAQTAAKLILEPIFEADLEPCVYGYRPKRSAGDAIRKWISCCMKARRVVDKHMLRLVKMWLTVPVEETDEKGKKRLTDGSDNDRGTPHGWRDQSTAG